MLRSGGDMAQPLAVIGGGSWGTAQANLLAQKGHPVRLWIHNRRLADNIEQQRENVTYLPGVKLAESIQICTSIEQALGGMELVVMAVPSLYLRIIAQQMKPYISPQAIIISTTKGIEQKTLLRMSQVVAQELPARVGVLSGPSFAMEVAKHTPTAVVAASADPRVAKTIQSLFHTSFFRVYTNDDPLGTELGGALKNIIALATGVSDGLGFGQNTRSALITRSLMEITRLGSAMGAKPITFLGLAGVGDLVLTCTGDLSRNRRVGLQIGRGQKLNQILADMKMVAEGVNTTKSAMGLAEKYGVEMPITRQVYAVLFEDKSPRRAVEELLSREMKNEFADIVGH
jgi:glycerol-3-phosphate dehydrogenase (NAD(P)+)